MLDIRISSYTFMKTCAVWIHYLETVSAEKREILSHWLLVSIMCCKHDVSKVNSTQHDVNKVKNMVFTGDWWLLWHFINFSWRFCEILNQKGFSNKVVTAVITVNSLTYTFFLSFFEGSGLFPMCFSCLLHLVSLPRDFWLYVFTSFHSQLCLSSFS